MEAATMTPDALAQSMLRELGVFDAGAECAVLGVGVEASRDVADFLDHYRPLLAVFWNQALLRLHPNRSGCGHGSVSRFFAAYAIRGRPGRVV